MNQEICSYLSKKKDLQESLLKIFTNDIDSDEYQQNFTNIIKFHLDYQNNPEELKDLIYLIANISKNHHRQEDFFTKMEKLLIHFKDSFTQNFTNFDLFYFFRNDKRLLLLLSQIKIIVLDGSIINFLRHIKYQHYFFYFLPEFSPFLKPDRINQLQYQIKLYDANYPAGFEEKRQKGENDSHLCYLIRKDSIEEFIQYVNKNSISLSSTISSSIYETNSFLLKNKATLIEYAAFFGSIQIFQYLYSNQVELGNSIWHFVIHGNNAELVQFLQEKNISPIDKAFNLCFIESIKCHHNEIAAYIKDILLNDGYLNESLSDNNFESGIQSYIIHYHNYLFIDLNNINNDYILYYLMDEDYVSLTKLFMKSNSIEMDQILNNKLFFSMRNLIISSISRPLKNFTNLKTAVILPSVTSIIIDNYSFYKSSKLRKITIPSSVTSIDGGAFDGCSSLMEISIPSSVTEIGNLAFSGCSMLKKISIPSSVTSVGVGLFNGCSSLVEVSIPSSITSIGDSFFKGCTSLVEMTFQSSVTDIGEYAFSECTSLTGINISSTSITSIKKGTFEECTSLKQIEIPSSVTSIEENAFEKCSSLVQVSIPSSVTSIGIYAFKECSSLTQISIPSSVKRMGYCVFLDCLKLRKVSFSASIECIGDYSFRGCKSLIRIIIPSSVNVIGNYAFSNCSSLRQVIIPSSVTKIGEFAFNQCTSLTMVSIPSSVTSIGKSIFYECSLLEKISIPSSLSSNDLGIGANVQVNLI